MTKSIVLPKPLFDTLAALKEGTPNGVWKTIESTKIPEAKKEYELAREFLLSYSGSLDTFNSYRREVERLLHWTWLIRKTAVKHLTRNDLRDYVEFSCSPHSSWISTKTVARFTTNNDGEREANPDWRPYVVRVHKAQRHAGKTPDTRNYQLSNKSIQALFSGLSTYFTYLQQETYIEINPVNLIRQKKRFIQRQQTQRITRKLSHTQWLYVIESAEKLADHDQKNERILFMMSAFYLLGLRVSELAETPGRIPCMGDFAPDKNSLWWFTTLSKGNKVRDVAIPDEMLEILKRYRKSRGLSALPLRGEQTPILEKQRGKGGLGTRQVRNLVQKCFDHAIYRLEKAGKVDDAQDLAAATVHWLRHTAISFSIEENRPREDIRDDVGHESAATMDKYIDTDRIARHRSAQKKHLKPTSK